MKPFFSVVITTYNRALFLDEALATLLAQSYKNFEVVIIDNFSKDNTSEIVNKFSSLDIKFFKYKNEGVISLSRNFALSKCAGEWIAFLDSDDLWMPDKLQKSHDAIDERQTVIYHGMAILKNNVVSGKLRTRQLSKPFLEDLLLKGNTIAFSSSVVRKCALEMIRGFNCSKSMINTADFNAWLKLAEINMNFTYLPDTLGIYRIHENNLSNDSYLSQANAAVDEFVQFLKLKDQSKIKNLLIYTQALTYSAQEKYSLATNHYKSIRLKYSFVLWLKSRARLIHLFLHTLNWKFHIEK